MTIQIETTETSYTVTVTAYDDPSRSLVPGETFETKQDALNAIEMLLPGASH